MSSLTCVDPLCIAVQPCTWRSTNILDQLWTLIHYFVLYRLSFLNNIAAHGGQEKGITARVVQFHTCTFLQFVILSLINITDSHKITELHWTKYIVTFFSSYASAVVCTVRFSQSLLVSVSDAPTATNNAVALFIRVLLSTVNVETFWQAFGWGVFVQICYQGRSSNWAKWNAVYHIAVLLVRPHLQSVFAAYYNAVF